MQNIYHGQSEIKHDILSCHFMHPVHLVTFGVKPCLNYVTSVHVFSEVLAFMRKGCPMLTYSCLLPVLLCPSTQAYYQIPQK